MDSKIGFSRKIVEEYQEIYAQGYSFATNCRKEALEYFISVYGRRGLEVINHDLAFSSEGKKEEKLSALFVRRKKA